MPKTTCTARLLLNKKGFGVDVVAPDDTVLHALRRMVEHDTRAVLVIEGERLVGIMTEHDYARGGEIKGRTAGDTRVREIMTSDPITVAPDANIVACNLLLHNHRIHHLPVVENDRILGLISAHDVLEKIVDEEEEQIHGLETERLMINTGNY
jgi:CBS domain-containing protein